MQNIYPKNGRKINSRNAPQNKRYTNPIDDFLKTFNKIALFPSKLQAYYFKTAYGDEIVPISIYEESLVLNKLISVNWRLKSLIQMMNHLERFFRDNSPQQIDELRRLLNLFKKDLFEANQKMRVRAAPRVHPSVVDKINQFYGNGRAVISRLEKIFRLNGIQL